MENPVPLPQHDTPATSVLREEDGIIVIEYPRSTRIGLALAEQTFRARCAMLAASGKRRHRLLMLGSGVTSFDYAAGRHASSREVAATIAASAIVCSTTLERHMGSIFVHMWRPPYPVQLFDSVAEARRWLQGFPDE